MTYSDSIRQYAHVVEGFDSAKEVKEYNAHLVLGKERYTRRGRRPLPNFPTLYWPKTVRVLPPVTNLARLGNNRSL